MRKLLLISVLPLLLALPPAQAGQGDLLGWLAGELLARGDDRYDLDEAVSRARKRTDGRVLSAETREREGRRSHDIRVITRDGRVRRLRVDPATGEFMDSGRGRGRGRGRGGD